MSESIDVAIGVVKNRVIARWHEPLAEIEFDPANAYKIGLALCHAALEAHSGDRDSKDLEVVDGELAQVRVVVTDTQRDMMIARVASILHTFIGQKRTPGYMAMHCVDEVLKETAR